MSLKNNKQLDNVKALSMSVLDTELYAKYLLESTSLLQIFPEEIWHKIVTKVKEVSTLERLNNSSLYFRKLLAPNRVLFLFPSVYSHIVHHFPKLESPSAYLWEYDDNFVGPRRWTWSVLKLRQVCTDWCQGVDNFIQKRHYIMRETPFKDDLLPEYCGVDIGGAIIYPKYYHDFDSWSIRRFLRFFKKSHSSGEANRSPFIARDIRITSQYPNNHVNRVLEKYGHGIWYCTVNLKDNYPSRSECYSRLKSVLMLLPNLQVLNIVYRRSSEEYSEIPVVGLPKLEKLKYLKTQYLPVPVFNELIQENRHVSMLQMERYSSAFDSYNIYDFGMPNLSKLYIQYYTQADFQKLSSTSVNWPLTSLHLDFEDCPFFEWSHIFDLLENKWENTLTDLIINLPRTKMEKQENQIMRSSPSYQLKLKRLKQIKLVIGNFSSLDFLLHCKNTLETLTVNVRYNFDVLWETPQGKEVRAREKLGLMECMRTSEVEDHSQKLNVWELMPKLKTIVCYYTRAATSLISRIKTARTYDRPDRF